MDRISVLHITPFFHPNIGGVETHLNDLVSLFKKHNDRYSVSVITYQPLVGKIRGDKKEVDGNIEINRISWIPGLYYKTIKNPALHFLYLTPWLFINTFFYLLKNNRSINILHGHGINGAFCGALLKCIFKKPLIVSIHVDFTFPEKGLTRAFYIWPLKQADKILAPTERARAALVDLGNQEDKVERYAYWIDQNLFKPVSTESARKQLGWNKKGFYGLFIGRLIRDKGVDVLINVAKKLPNATFVFAGSGDLSDEIAQLSKSVKNVIFLGRVDNKELSIYYNAANVLLVPSATNRRESTFEESIPRVTIEALSCGTPIIGSDSGGIKEVIETGRVGLVVPSNIQSYSQAIETLMKDARKLKVLEERCRKYATERFSISNAEVFTDAYEEISNKINFDNRLKLLLSNTGDMALKRRAWEMINGLQLRTGDKVLDVGCGDGYYSHLLSSLSLAISITGTDFDRRGLVNAEKNLKDKNIKLVFGDLMNKLPFKDSYFDKIIMSEVMEHLPDDLKGLREVYRVLKPSGIICVSVPNQKYPFFWDPVNNVLEMLFNKHIDSGFWAGIWNQHNRLYEHQRINELFERTGFKVRQSKVLTRWCLPFNHYIVNLVARQLAKGNLTKSVTNSLSKYNINPNRPTVLNLAFMVANTVDRLNDYFPAKNIGVGIYIKAIK